MNTKSEIYQSDSVFTLMSTFFESVWIKWVVDIGVLIILSVFIFRFFKWLIKKMSVANPDLKKMAPFGPQALLVHLLILVIAITLIMLAAAIEAGSLLSLSTLKTVLKELGFAGIIAITVMYTLEVFAKKQQEDSTQEQLRLINENLFLAVYGRNMPKSILTEMDSSIISSRSFRSDLDISYHFHPLPEDHPCYPEYFFLCTSSITYRLTNAMETTVKNYPFRTSLEKPVGYQCSNHSDIKVTQFTVSDINNSIKFVDLSTPDEILEFTDDSSPSHIDFEYSEINLAPGQEVIVTITSTLLKEKKGYEIWESFIPTDNLKLIVDLPVNYSVHASAAHSQEPRKVNTGKNIGLHQWKLDAGILPTQSIIFWWDDHIEGGRCDISELQKEVIITDSDNVEESNVEE